MDAVCACCHPTVSEWTDSPYPDQMAIELVTTDGVFVLDGGEWEVTNNIWLVGDDREVLVFDAAHDHEPIVAAINGRRVAGIVLTHGHNDHINAAVALRDAVDAPISLHVDDRMLWDIVYPGHEPDLALESGKAIEAGGHKVTVIHTPGHSPGCCCFHDDRHGLLLSGDTLFCGGPGATGRSYSDEESILRSISDQLLTLPRETLVHTGHGADTTIGDESERVIARMAELGIG